MGISWVAGSGPSRVATTTTVNTPSSPAGLANDDGLYAFVMHYPERTITPPAGWTEVAATTATAGGSVLVGYTAFRKNTVTSGDASTAFTFTASSSTTMHLHYAAVRASVGDVVDAQYQVYSINTSSAAFIDPSPVTALRDDEIVLAAAGSYYAPALSGHPTVPTGMTQWTGNLAINCAVGAYQLRNAGQVSSTGNFDWGISAPANFPVSDNALLTIVIRVKDSAFAETITRGIGISRTFGEVLADIAEGIGILEAAVTFVEIQAAVAEGVAVSPALVIGAFRAGATVSEVVGVLEAQLAAWRLTGLLTDTTTIADVAACAAAVGLAESLGMARTLTAVQGTQILLGLGLLDTVLPAARYSLPVTDVARLSPALARFLGADVAETVGSNDTLAVINRMTPALVEALGVADALTPKLFLSLTVPEGLQVTDTQALRMSFRPTIADGVRLDAAHIQINGSATTWVVNAATGAVTTYSDYVFNSFTRPTPGRYLGASETGLYALEGDTDDGEDIIASLKTGLAQMAGSRFSGLKAVYFGIRGEGDFVLKIIEGDGTERTYATSAANMRTARINTGKGIRTRYLAFELISTGQDFDLDSIDMIPLLMQRRV